jgi:hypothetical protein
MMLRGDLEWLRAKTIDVASAQPPSYGRTKAEQRSADDDKKSGRLDMWIARRSAERGIEALDRGDRVAARAYYDSGMRAYAAALEAPLRPTDIADFGKLSGKRGRKQTEEKPVASSRGRGRPKKK